MKEEEIRQNSWQAWLLAARPKTLSGALVPVIIGICMAIADRPTDWNWIPALLCLAFAMIMQIDANFINDYFDYIRGNDDETRLGPKRACSEGWITEAAMRKGIGMTTAIAALTGLPLIYWGGYEMILVGVCCIVFCFLYTTILAYHGMGDVLVILFFGLVPVTMSFYLTSRDMEIAQIPYSVVMTSIACGLVIDTLLIVNNYRDIDNDRKAGKKTLVVRMGRMRSGITYLGLGWIACLIGVIFLWEGRIWAFILPACCYLPIHTSTYKMMRRIGEGRELNKVLGKTSINMLVYGLALCVGILVSVIR